MDRLGRIGATIRGFLSRLSTTQQLLIGSLAVLMVMALFLVRQYTATPPMVPLFANATSEENSRAASMLAAAGVEHRVDEGGRVEVPASARMDAMARLTEGGGLPADNTITFDTLNQHQKWTNNHQQNAQLEQIALQNTLARIIAQMRGIRSAEVMVDVQQKRQLGMPASRPTASVSVESESGITQATADAIAQLVASSRAGLSVDRVRIIDATTNSYFRPRTESDFNAGSYLELATKVEERKREQIYEWLSRYIPGVIVVVHAQVDATRVQKQRNAVLPEGEGTVSLVKTESTSSLQQTDAESAGEAGVRPNTGSTIDTAGGGGSSTSERTGDTDFVAEFGNEVTSTDDPRGMPTKINAVVNVPRAYFVDVWKQRNGAPADGVEAAGAADPTDTELEPVMTSELERIRREVQTMVDTTASGLEGAATVTSSVEVSMIPVAPSWSIVPGAAGAATMATAGVGMAGLSLNGLVRTAVLGVFALVAMGLVAVMALKSTKRQELPSVQDLVGLPPALETDSGVVGEALESDTELIGLELSDDEITHQELLKQVGSLVKSHPEEAAVIVGRWVKEVN